MTLGFKLHLYIRSTIDDTLSHPVPLAVTRVDLQFTKT